MNSVIPILAAAVVSGGLVLAPSSALGQPTLAWIWQSEIDRTDFAAGISADGLGNAYFVGDVYYDFDGDTGRIDGVLSKFDATGNQQWSREIRTDDFDYASAVTTDGRGSVFVAGTTWGNLAATNAGVSDGYVAKYDTAGNRLWLKQLGIISNEFFRDVAVDDNGNVIVSGTSRGSFAGAHAGQEDVIVIKFDASGNTLWSRQFGGPGTDSGRGVAVDKTGAIYLAGSTATYLFPGDPATAYNGFLSKYDAEGIELWTRKTEVANDGLQVGTLSIDDLGNVFVTGGLERIDAQGARIARAFLTKYDAAGDLHWTRELEHLPQSWGLDVAADGLGNAFIAGRSGGGRFGNDTSDAFVSKYDSAGNLAWTWKLGTDAQDSINGISVDPLGNIFVAGSTNGILGGPNSGNSIYPFSDSWVALLHETPAPKAGDFDNDGNVDGRDFLALQRNPSIGSLADWQANYGAGGSLTAADVSVPEPTSATLLGLVLLGGASKCNRRRR